MKNSKEKRLAEQLRLMKAKGQQKVILHERFMGRQYEPNNF